MSVLVCPGCGHELMEGGEKCNDKTCPCKCLEASFHRSIFETRGDRAQVYDDRHLRE